MFGVSFAQFLLRSFAFSLCWFCFVSGGVSSGIMHCLYKKEILLDRVVDHSRFNDSRRLPLHRGRPSQTVTSTLSTVHRHSHIDIVYRHIDTVSSTVYRRIHDRHRLLTHRHRLPSHRHSLIDRLSSHP